MRFAVAVEVRLKEGVADPQGATIERSLPTLGFDGIDGVRVGKAIRFAIEADDEGSARDRVEELCKRFLTNPVIEDATISLTVNGPDNFTMVQDYAVEAGGKAQKGKLTMSYRRLGECK